MMFALRPPIPSRRHGQFIIQSVEMTIAATCVEKEFARQVNEVIAEHRLAL